MKGALACYFLVSVMALFTFGCSGKSRPAKMVILQNPETMEFVKCNVGQWGADSQHETNEECVEDYKQQGYVVWGKQD